ncbi:MAG: hypothetical protein AAF226_08275, partial [Verrucomicrobiota bacterium]
RGDRIRINTQMLNAFFRSIPALLLAFLLASCASSDEEKEVVHGAVSEEKGGLYKRTEGKIRQGAYTFDDEFLKKANAASTGTAVGDSKVADERGIYGWTTDAEGNVISSNGKEVEKTQFRGGDRDFGSKQFKTKEARTKEYRTPDYIARQQYGRATESRFSGENASQGDFDKNRTGFGSKIFGGADKRSASENQTSKYSAMNARLSNDIYKTDAYSPAKKASQNAARPSSVTLRDYNQNQNLSIDDVRMLVDPSNR